MWHGKAGGEAAEKLNGKEWTECQICLKFKSPFPSALVPGPCLRCLWGRPLIRLVVALPRCSFQGRSQLLVSSRAVLPAAPATLISPLLPCCALHSSQTWTCVLFDPTDPAAGRPPWGRYPGQLSVTSASLWDCPEPGANQWPSLRAGSPRTRSLPGGGFSLGAVTFQNPQQGAGAGACPALWRPCGSLELLPPCKEREEGHRLAGETVPRLASSPRPAAL